MSTATRAESDVYYPDSDGQPMGETGIHVNTTLDLLTALKLHVFKGRPDVYVAADMFFYYEQGNPRAVKAPDVMVIKGLSHPEERRTFKLWVEGVVPCVIFEITSAGTRRDDLVIKRELYARLGVAEYYLFDPLGEYLEPRFRALRLVGAHYDDIPPSEKHGGFESPELGVELRPVGPRVYAYHSDSGRKIPSLDDTPDLFDRYEDVQRDLAIALKNREKLVRKADREKKKADDERLKAEAERKRADGLEAELNRLRALLGEGGKTPGA